MIFENETKALSDMDAMFARKLEEHRELHTEAAKSYVSAQNVVCVVHLSENVALRRVAMCWPNKYVTQKFEACIVRLRWGNSCATLLLFRTGNTVCVGTKSVEESMLACHTLRLELHAQGYKTFFGHFRPVNGVYSFAVKHCVDLAKLWRENLAVAQWEPELFPGLELILRDDGAVVRVFDSGNCVLMGVSDFRLRGAITRNVRMLLEQYKDARVPEEERFDYRNTQKDLISGHIPEVSDTTRKRKAPQNTTTKKRSTKRTKR